MAPFVGEALGEVRQLWDLVIIGLRSGADFEKDGHGFGGIVTSQACPRPPAKVERAYALPVADLPGD